MECPKCHADYFEEFSNGGYCFGCSYRSQYEAVHKRNTKPEFYVQKRFTLSHHDYEHIKNKWGIRKKQADHYGLHVVTTDGLDRWLYFPVYNEVGKEIFFQCRQWNKYCWGNKYKSSSMPLAGTIWKSKANTKRYKWIAVVEGIPDGIRVGELLPTAALLGSDINDKRLESLQEYGKKFVILLDSDVPGKMLSLHQKLGLYKSVMVQLPHGDPTDYSRHALRKLIKNGGVKL